MNRMNLIRQVLSAVLVTSAMFAPGGANAASAVSQQNLIEMVQKNAEQQVRHMIEPLLDKYCHEQCRLMNVSATVDVATPEQVAPGFDDVEIGAGQDLAPSSARVRILINDKVGPVTKQKFLELVQQFLDTLDYPVKIETQTAHFPQPTGSESKVAELREKITRQFKNTVEELLNQFCPKQCMVADFNLSTDVVNGEEAQYGSPGEFAQDGDTAIKIKDISATLLMDESLTPEERNNILQMAKLKTTYFRNVSLSAKSLKFPHPELNEDGTYSFGDGTGIAGGRGRNGKLSSEKLTKDEKNTTSNSNNSTNQSSTNTSTENKNTTAANTNNTNNSNSSNSSSDNSSSTRQEKFERIEKIERVESGDAVQAELKKFQVYGLVFACSIISLLIFIAMSAFRPQKTGGKEGGITRVIQSLASDPVSNSAPQNPKGILDTGASDKYGNLSKRFEIESLHDELMNIFATQPRVAKVVFSRILTEEGVEVTAQYMTLFGETIVMDMLRDPSLQSDLAELMEFYAKNPMDLNDEEKLDLLRKLHNRTVAGKLLVMGNRSSNLFDFLAEMDGLQILELIRNENLTVKSITLTQVDPQKRAAIYSQLDQDVRMNLLAELSRIDYLPRDYIFNVANALKRKRRENPRLNTEALPGSEVLVSLLERTSQSLQKNVVKSLEVSNPDSARTVKSKLVSIDTLKFLRDGQLLEVILSLKHDELLQFLKGAPPETKTVILSKSPKELVIELEEELANVSLLSREAYAAVERKVFNRMKMMANEGLINLIETNERMFGDNAGESGFIETGTASGGDANHAATASIKKVAGW